VIEPGQPCPYKLLLLLLLLLLVQLLLLQRPETLMPVHCLWLLAFKGTSLPGLSPRLSLTQDAVT
jgi:hypothetical protein